MKLIKTILVQLFTGANIATLILLWACCAVTFVSPEQHPRLALLTYAFPFILAFNVLFVLFWLVFKVKRVWIPIAGIALCWSFIRDYIPLNFTGKSTTELSSDSTLTILSYNSCHYGTPNANLEDGTNAVETHLEESGADIICLQESLNRSGLTERMEAKGYHLVNAKEFTIYSRLPILSYDTIAIPDYSCHALRAYLAYGNDTIMLINQHLQSNKLSLKMKDAYRESIKTLERDSMRKDITPILQFLTQASPSRAMQTDNIADEIDAWLPRPIIVCGDFNDTPISYTHRLLTRRLASAYRESGNGLGFTFREKGFPVRIDHILFNEDYWRSVETHVENDFSYSDHFPIRTKLVKKAP